MKKFIIMLVLLAGSFLMTGCSTPVDTASERQTRLSDIGKIQMKQAVDDWDYLWLCDRSSSLSEWHIGAGR